MSDDGFHEIQLGRKQLIFLGMAVAVTAVVVFLIGVWVGRNAPRPDSEIVADVPTADIAPDTPQPPTQVAPTDLDYSARVQSGAGGTEAKPGETAKPIEPPTPAAESGPPEPAPAVKTPPVETAAAAAAAAKPAPSTGGVTLQVAAFGAKKPADTLMNKLKKKGYTAYVFTATSGPSRFKVRVGPFADSAAADVASARLKKEEGLSPLVQR